MKKITIIIGLLIFIYIVAFKAGKVFSQSVLPLTVIPARNQIEIEPGEKYSLPVNFYNQSDSPVSGFFKVADFIVDDNQGTPRLIENPDEAPGKFSASRWVTLLYDRATLPANEKVSLQVDINVPQDARPGGRYVAVFFQSSGETPSQTGVTEEAGSGTALRIASLMYIKIKGPVSEKALISRFFTPYFFEYGPIKMTTDILNRGDSHVTPRGVISLTNMFGGLVDQTIIKEKNVFPDSIRSYETELGKKWLIGRYKINFSGSYGESGQALTAYTYAWVFPWRVAIVVVLTLTIIILFGSNFYKSFVKKESTLEEEVKLEKEEIEKLKEQLRKQK